MYYAQSSEEFLSDSFVDVSEDPSSQTFEQRVVRTFKEDRLADRWLLLHSSVFFSRLMQKCVEFAYN